MKIKTRLLLGFVGCGVVPLLVVGLANYWTANQGMTAIQAEAQQEFREKATNQLVSLRDVKKGQIEDYFAGRKRDMSVLAETVATLREEAFNKLTAVRQIKQQAVLRYYQTINDQMITFPEDQMVIDATREFRNSIKEFRKENATTPEKLAGMKEKLLAYYEQDFTAEYKKTTQDKLLALLRSSNSLMTIRSPCNTTTSGRISTRSARNICSIRPATNRLTARSTAAFIQSSETSSTNSVITISSLLIVSRATSSTRFSRSWTTQLH